MEIEKINISKESKYCNVYFKYAPKNVHTSISVSVETSELDLLIFN